MNVEEFQFRIRWKEFSADQDTWKALSIMFEDIIALVARFLESSMLKWRAEATEFLLLQFSESPYWGDNQCSKVEGTGRKMMCNLKRNLLEDLVVVTAVGEVVHRI
eukprot:snap_masked-scaffold_11-processed-gene-10.25-mRNA-1 protein AED:1.00 eAED:1.00 QI:0/-1/0/0/-1/1/1/0/105